MNKHASNAILHESEMKAWFSDEDNHYLAEVEGDTIHVTPFVCDFEVVGQKGVVELRGVTGDGLGYDLVTKELHIIKRT